ncbi:hypothetical protein PanWU01x14_280920, partial [Parasponia andersonii]
LSRILRDCECLLQQIQVWVLPLVPREANSSAHNLAHWFANSDIVYCSFNFTVCFILQALGLAL